MPITKTIYVDMDDVLCQTAHRFLILLEREFGKQVAYENLTTFDLEQACQLQPHELEDLLDIAHRPEELLAMEPIDGAKTVLHNWRLAGYEIAIVTGRPPSSAEPSQEWLAQYQIPHDSFHIVDKYARFSTESTIGITLAELATRQFCWVVEDSLNMAVYVADQMQTRVALLDWPWNQSTLTHPRIARYTNWDEIAHALPSDSLP